MDTWLKEQGLPPIDALFIQAQFRRDSVFVTVYAPDRCDDIVQALQALAVFEIEPYQKKNSNTLRCRLPTPQKEPQPWNMETDVVTEMNTLHERMQNATSLAMWWTIVLESLPTYYKMQTGRTHTPPVVTKEIRFLQRSKAYYSMARLHVDSSDSVHFLKVKNNPTFVFNQRESSSYNATSRRMAQLLHASIPCFNVGLGASLPAAAIVEKASALASAWHLMHGKSIDPLHLETWMMHDAATPSKELPHLDNVGPI